MERDRGQAVRNGERKRRIGCRVEREGKGWVRNERSTEKLLGAAVGQEARGRSEVTDRMHPEAGRDRGGRMGKTRKRKGRWEDENDPSMPAWQKASGVCEIPIDYEEVKRAFERDGLVIIPVLTSDECDSLILEQWQNILLQQPWKEEYKIKVRGSDGSPLDLQADRAEFLKVVKGPLSRQRREEFERGWCLHRGFGACCDPQSFHAPGVWKIRQDPRLYRLASTILDRKDLWVDINRSIQKLPGQGETKFLHWDMNPMEEREEQEEAESVCGKVCYTPSRFVAVLGTHTSEFHRQFRKAYRSLYPHVKPGDPKFALDHRKDDPLRLFQRQQTLPIPAGSLVLWHPRLLHGQAKTPHSDPVEYGCYLGYFPAGSRAAYQQKCGVDEREDRVSCFQLGKAPRLWPSLDTIHFFPKRFLNFPRILQSYIDKLPPNHPAIQTRRTAAGAEVPTLEPVLDPAYSPPPLSSLGKLLLGIKPWPSCEDVEEDVIMTASEGTRTKSRKKSAEEVACGYNSLREEGGRIGSGDVLNKALLVTKKQLGYGLRMDMEVYAEGLQELDWEVKTEELVRMTAGKARACKGSHPSVLQLRKQLQWCDVLIGFEYLGDSTTWQVIEEEMGRREEEGRRAMKVVLVPNLEYCKASNEATSDTMKKLGLVDVIVAKTEDVFQRLQRLFLFRKFSHGLGNLVLIPHTSMLRLPPIERDARRRRSIIHFHGSSKLKNSLENCQAARVLLQQHPDVFDRLIVKCSTPGNCKVCDQIRRSLAEEARLTLVRDELSEDEKFALYSSCRLALCASTSEGFGHHVLEAAALGCQVVTTDGMPTRSVLTQQVALARPQGEGSSFNLGLRYRVSSAEIARAAGSLLLEAYEPEACQENLRSRIRSFKQHLRHLVSLLSRSSSTPCCCCCSQHHRPQLDVAVCPECGERMAGELRPVNAQAPDRLVLCCSNCGHEEKA